MSKLDIYVRIQERCSDSFVEHAWGENLESIKGGHTCALPRKQSCMHNLWTTEHCQEKRIMETNETKQYTILCSELWPALVDTTMLTTIIL